MKRLWVLSVMLVLAACATPRPHPFAVPSPFQVPMPFVSADQNTALLSSITQITSVVTEPIEGLSDDQNQLLLQEIAQAAQANDIPLTLVSSARSAERLRGRFEEQAVDSAGMHGVIHWRLETSDGETLDAFDVASPLGAGVQSAAWRDAIAQATASKLGASIDARPLTVSQLTGSRDTSEPRGAPILIPRVIGAPGDGNLTLTRAVRAFLTESDVFVVDPNSPPDAFDTATAYTLQGQVQMGEPLAGPNGYGAGQPIAIAWDLYGPGGNHLGNVAQENMVEPGSLDGPWGEVAIYAAMGAVEGILTLLTMIPPQPR